MLASERLAEIRERFRVGVRRLVPLELDGETLRLILYLDDGTNLRVAEAWDGPTLRRYSTYWLTAEHELKVGWDNAPHHRCLEGFPHHKHAAEEGRPEKSSETCLEEVMEVVLAALEAERGSRG